MRTALSRAALLIGLVALASVSFATTAPVAVPAAGVATVPAAPAPATPADPATLAAILGIPAPVPAVNCTIVCPPGKYCCVVGLRPTCYPWNKPCP